MFPRAYFAAGAFAPRYFPPAVVASLIGLAARMRLGRLGSHSAAASLPNANRAVPSADLMALFPELTTEIGPKSATGASDHSPHIDSARVIP